MAEIVHISPSFLGSPVNGVDLYQLPSQGLTAIGDIINASWNSGLDAKNEFHTRVGEAVAGIPAQNALNISAGAISAPTIAEPNVSIPTSIDTSSIMGTFDSKYLELVQLLVDKFTAFRASYFPDESNAYVAAENWLQAAIADPSGLPPAVVAQIWGDDQARILSDKTRAQDAVLAQFAGRRFPLPPDTAASAVMQIEQKAQDDMAESSRKVAILSVELQKFNVEKLLGLRQIAMSSTIEYIKALASGPEMASRVIGVGYDAQSKLISSAAAFYGARTQAAEVVAKVAQYNNSTQFDVAEKNQAANLQLVEDRIKALVEESRSIAQMATALFNNLHAQVGMSVSGGLNGNVVAQ